MKTKRVVLAAAVVLVATACEQSPTAVTGAAEFEPAALVVPTGAAFQLMVCKAATSGGPFEFSLSNLSSGMTAPLGMTFNLDRESCAVAATTTASSQSATVAENVPAGFTLDKIEVYQFLTGSNAQTLIRTTTGQNFETVSPLGNDAGYVVVFYNSEDPVVSLPGRMTGGGSVFLGDVRFTHGFELHCDVNDLPNNLEVNWPDNRFHLTALTSVVCTDDPALHPLPRRAGFDTYTATGVGLWNGQPGATIDFEFTDDGEPGRKDHATMTITPAGGSPVTVSGYLTKGNHQAHWVN